MKWRQKAFKLLSVFTTGYSGGFIAVLPTNYLTTPGSIDIQLIFSIPIMTGIVFALPQIGKMFGEMANES